MRTSQAVHRFARATAASLLGGLVLATLPAGALPIASAAADPADGAPTPAAAQALAASSGERVEVLSARGERQQLFARPGGGFTLEESSDARRVLQNGRWADVDTTLQVAGDGSVHPKAAAIDLTLSAGGTQPLVRVADDGAALAVTFPKGLPAPTLDGDTATYADVLPDVDLEVRAHAESFSEVLVVKTPEAARNPALHELTFRTSTSGGTLQEQSDGGFAVENSAGQALLDSPQPYMWDSSGTNVGDPTDASAPDPGDRISDTTGATADQHAPAEGDKVAAIPTDVSAGEVTLAPPTSLLNDPSATYPLYIDPTVAGNKQHWAMVNKTYGTTSYFDWNDADQGMGYNSYAGINVKRLFWQFPTTAIKGTTVSAARFSAFETFAANCNGGAASLYSVGPISASTTWNNQPGIGAKLDTQTLAAGRPDCNPNGLLVTWNALDAARGAAAQGADNTTLGLIADNETTNDGWKRFRSDATLSIDYDSVPTLPQPNEIGTSPSTTCMTGPGRPVLGQTPLLSAVTRDPDPNDLMYGTFVVTDLKTGSATWYDSTRWNDNGKAATVQPAALPEGTYSWKVRAVDQLIEFSNFTTPCEFEVDTTAPAVTPTVSSVEYPSGSYAGAPNRTGWFVFGPNGVSDVASYEYTFDSGSTKTRAAPRVGAAADVPFSPTSAGTHSVRVSSLDRAGNRSPALTYNFSVRDIQVSDHQWEFDGDADTATAARDTSGTRDATYTTTTGAASTAGRAYVASTRHDDSGSTRAGDKAVQLDGSSCAVTTASPVIDPTQPFSVTAQVKIDRLASNADLSAPTGVTGIQRLVSQDGSGGAAMSLAYDGNNGGFTFALRNGDGTVTTARTTPSDTATAIDNSAYNRAGWIALGATYAVGGQMQLFLNGQPRATAATTAPAASTGPFRLGCSQGAGARLVGTLDDVRTWPQALAGSTMARISFELAPSLNSDSNTRAGQLAPGTAQDTLASGQHLLSADGKQDLWMKPDGNLVLTGPLGARWQSNTASAANAGASAVMQPDGKLVLKNSAGTATLLRPAVAAGAVAQVGNSGSLELVSSSGTVVSTTALPSTLNSGRLNANDQLQSASGIYRLVMQADGNLVLSAPSGYTWASAEHATNPIAPNSFAQMQSDGNFVIYAPSLVVTFVANGQTGAHLVLQDDGNLVLYAGTTPTWSTLTGDVFP